VTDRVALLRRGERLESVTVAYNALEGGVAVVAGVAAGSVALTGFRAELGAARVGPAVEARAARWAGVLLLALAVYIVAESGRRLLTGDRPGESVVGIVLTALSLIVMPLLARAKLRVAASLGSPGTAGGRARDNRLRVAVGDDSSWSGPERGARLVVGRSGCRSRDGSPHLERRAGGVAGRAAA